jgi:hypothetical protein
MTRRGGRIETLISGEFYIFCFCSLLNLSLCLAEKVQGNITDLRVTLNNLWHNLLAVQAKVHTTVVVRDQASFSKALNEQKKRFLEKVKKGDADENHLW